jgi:hypothetical protein
LRRSKHLLASLALALCALGFGVASATAEPPQAIAPQVSGVSYTTAHVEGEVDPKGQFAQWAIEVSTNGTDWEWKAGGGVEGSGLQSVEGDLEGLKPGTKYEVRLSTLNYEEFVTYYSAEPNPEFTTKSLPAPTVSIEPASAFTGTTASLTGTIDPNSPVGNPSASNVDWHFECTPECPGLEGGTVPAAATGSEQEVEAQAKHLEPNTTYEVTLVGKNAGEPVSDGPVSFKTTAVVPAAQPIPAFPLAGGVEAQIAGRINPHNSATTYWLKWGPTTAYGNSTPHEAVGAGGSPVIKAQQIAGLTPHATYHFQVVAESPSGTTESEDMSFTTPEVAENEPTGSECPNAEFRTGPSAALSECRAYELVSTEDLLGEPAIREFTTHPLIPVSPNGERVLWKSIAHPDGHDSTGTADTWRSSRTASGWVSEFVNPPGSKTKEITPPQWASRDLGKITFATHWATIDPEDHEPGEWEQPSETDIYQREEDGSWRWINRPTAEFPEPHGGFDAQSEDGSTVYFDEGQGGAGIFRLSGNSLSQIYNDEAGNLLPTGAFGYGDGLVGMSADGSRALLHSETHLFLYDESLPHNVQLADGRGRLTHDGSRVIIVTPEALTSADVDTSSDLYEYDVATGTYRLLSIPTGAPSSPGPGNTDDCLTSLPNRSKCDVAEVALSRDGTSVYFVSPEQLDGDRGVSGQSNLYVTQGGETRYVTTLVPSDSGYWGQGPDIRRLTLSPDESHLLFQSRGQLTAYDNAGKDEVYSYDQQTQELSCASCRPSGEPPEGDSNLLITESERYGLQNQQAGSAMTALNSDMDGSHVFFQSEDPITPADSGLMYDVYEFDAATGRVSMISSGSTTSDAAYLGNSKDGRDVFFYSLVDLTASPVNQGSVKLFDARIGGGFRESATTALCRGEGCRQGSTSEPREGGPATEAFSGPGNEAVRAQQLRRALQACRKKKTARAKKRCKARAHHRFGGSSPTKTKKGAH